MPTADPNGQGDPQPGPTGTEGTPIARAQAAEEELLERIKFVARRITERVRKVIEDTGHQSTGPTETPPPA